MTLGAYAVCLCCVLRCFRYEGEGAGGQVELAASSAAEWSRARRGQVCQGFRLFLKTTSRKREKREEKRREREERKRRLSLSLFFSFFSVFSRFLSLLSSSINVLNRKKGGV